MLYIPGKIYRRTLAEPLIVKHVVNFGNPVLQENAKKIFQLYQKDLAGPQLYVTCGKKDKILKTLF
jgi:hypothetical protein